MPLSAEETVGKGTSNVFLLLESLKKDNFELETAICIVFKVWSFLFFIYSRYEKTYVIYF